MSDNQSHWLEQIRSYFTGLSPHPAAPPAVPVPPAPEPRQLGLALGGGGGKGAAHVGVLQTLEELGTPIDVIVGSSAGGAVAVLYAAGLSLDEIREAFRVTALRRVAVPDPTRTCLIGQRRRAELLRQLLGDRTFADLSIPCGVMTTDLVSGRPVLIKEGPLVEAVLATSALPPVFPPVVWDDMILADGGILNNLPVDAARALGATRVIAVELNDAVPGFSIAAPTTDSPLSRLMLAPQQFNVAGRALSLLINHATAMHLRDNPPDLLVSPYVADIPTLDFSNPEKGQAAGSMAARDLSNEIAALRAWRLEQPEPTPPPSPLAPDTSEADQHMPTPAWPWLSLPFQLPRWGEEKPAADRP